MARVVPERVLLAVRLDQRHALLGPAREAQVAQGFVVDGEEPAGRAVLRRHVPDRGSVGERQPGQAVSEVLDELPDDPRAAEDLRHGQHEVGRCRPLRKLTREAEADHLRHEHRDRLAEHRRLGLDPADAPAEHAEAVDHRRVRIGADEGVRERLPVARLDDAREVLEVDLVDDAGVRGDDLEVVERALAPAQERVPLAVSLELELGVPEDRARRRVLVHLHRVVDHELDRQGRVDPRRLAAQILHGIAHPGEVDDRRDAGEVLQEHARRAERDLVGRLGVRLPARDRLGIRVLAVAQHVLEQDAQRVRETLGAVGEAEELVALPGDGELLGGHPLRFYVCGGFRFDGIRPSP